MIKSVEEYLDTLKEELKGSDAATIQDALADAEEHLRAALSNLRDRQPEVPEDAALNQVIEQYGSPEETAASFNAPCRCNSIARLKRSATSLAWWGREGKKSRIVINKTIGEKDAPSDHAAFLKIVRRATTDSPPHI